MTAVDCPRLTSSDGPPLLITAQTLQELQPSSYNRSVGAQVRLTCRDGRMLYGKPLVTCLPSGQWDFQQKPTCVIVPEGSEGLLTPPPPRTADSLTEEQQIIIGVVVGAGALVLLVLLAIIIALLCRSRRDARTEKTPRGISASELYGFRTNSPATQETQLDGCSSGGGFPESRMNGDARSDRHFLRHHHPATNSVSSFPGLHHVTHHHAAGRGPWTGSRDSNPHHASLPTLLPPLSHVSGGGGQGPWERSRANSVRTTSVWSGPSSDVQRIDVFNRLALQRGHDPFLWRPGSESSAF